MLFLATDIKDLIWTDEDDELFNILYPRLRAAALAAAEAGIESIGVGVDWGLVNQAVLSWAKQYTYSLVRQINGTTKAFLQEALTTWIESGAPLDALMETLQPMFGSVRAEMIAVTETTRAFAEGNLAAWRESGVVSGKRWMTAVDDLVCPICEPLDGMAVGLDENGFTTEADGMGLTSPPAHVRCRCYLQPVVE